jgi:FixJ family two-component response regulator
MERSRNFLKKASLDRPGCVVLDYRLPTLSGLEVLRLLRLKSSVPAILISAYADVQTTVAAMEMGAATVFEKPLDDNSFPQQAGALLLRRPPMGPQAPELRSDTEDDRPPDRNRASRPRPVEQGLSNKAIARNLSKSVKAIERQRQNVVHKLDCNSVMEVLHKVQACPMQTAMPLACSRDNCPTSIS